MKREGPGGCRPINRPCAAKENNPHTHTQTPCVCVCCSVNTGPLLTTDCNYCYKAAAPVGRGFHGNRFKVKSSNILVSIRATERRTTPVPGRY